MNFNALLTWIIGRPPPETPKPASTVETTAVERRRSSRLPLSEGDAVIDNGAMFPVSDVSFRGIRLEIPDGRKPDGWQVGTTFSATLKLGTVRVVSQLKICNVWPSAIGCLFTGIAPQQSLRLADFLKPRLLGSSLREIRTSRLLENTGTEKMRWFQGDQDTNLYVCESNSGQLTKQELRFLDYCIIWECSTDTVRTARILGEGGKPGFSGSDRQLSAFFRTTSYRAVQLGQIVLHFSSLPAEVKDPFLIRLRREERCLYHRFLIAPKEQSVYLTLADFPQLKFSVVHLSHHGLSVLPPDRTPEDFFAPQSRPGTLVLADQSLPVKFTPSYRHAAIVVGLIEHSEPQGPEKISAYLAPRVLGQSLEEHTTLLEELPSLPLNSQSSLFVGVHNTHVLSVIKPNGILYLGRIGFMDRALVYDSQKFSQYKCATNVIFPRDWDLPHGLVEPLTNPESDVFEISRQLLRASNLPEPIVQAWMQALPISTGA